MSLAYEALERACLEAEDKIIELEAKLKIAVDGIKHLHKNAVFMDVVEGSKFMSDLLIKIETAQKAGAE